MTRELLETDIELARQLLEVGRQSHDVIATLNCRGLELERAGRLVDDLRSGREVKADPPRFVQLPVRRPKANEGEVGAESSSGPRHRHGRRKQRDDDGKFPWFRLAVFAAIIIAVAAVILSNRRARARAASPTESSRGAAAPAISATGLVLDIQDDGLHFCGQLVGRKDAFQTALRILGPPSRTNQVDGLKKTIYAYDTEGLLIYSRPGAGDDCMILYFDAVGGTNGAKLPFAGKLKIGEHQIQSTTDAKALAGIQSLGLGQPGTNSVLESRSEHLNLSFAYLKSPEQLSLIEIDFK